MVEAKQSKYFYPQCFSSVGYGHTSNGYSVLSQLICMSTTGTKEKKVGAETLRRIFILLISGKEVHRYSLNVYLVPDQHFPDICMFNGIYLQKASHF